MLEADKVTRDAGKLEHLHRFLPGEIESMFRWMMFGFKLSNEKRGLGCLGLGGEILPSDVGIIVSHSRDPYQTTSIMENKRVFSGFKLVLPSNQQEWPECQMFQMNLVVHEGRTFKSSFVRHEVIWFLGVGACQNPVSPIENSSSLFYY